MYVDLFQGIYTGSIDKLTRLLPLFVEGMEIYRHENEFSQTQNRPALEKQILGPPF